MRAAIYCRLSDEDRGKKNQTDDSDSILNQKAMLIKYASSNGWPIYDIYSDDDYTGANRNRPEFNRLIQDAKARRFEVILCKTQSRFTREVELVETYIHGLFPRLGIRFIGIVDNADTDDKGNKKARQINGLVNEWFLEELSENVRAVLTNRRQNGYHIGSFAPYGYQKDPLQKGHLIIDEEAARIVREVYELYAQGLGKQGIARFLNEQGVPNPTEYKRLHGLERNKKSRGSGLWSYFTISDMLVNQVYIGNMVQGKSEVASFKTQEKVPVPKERWIVVKNTHAPIIDQALWNQVQEIIALKATVAPVQAEGKFAWKVRCIHCGSRLHSVKNGNKRGFKCERHALAHDACVGAYISLPKLERIVAAQLQILSDELLDAQTLEESIDLYPDLRDMQTQIQEEIRVYERKMEVCNTGLRNLYLDKVKRVITDTEFREVSMDFKTEKERLAMQISSCQKKLKEIEITLVQKVNRKKLVQQYTGTRQLSKEMIDILVDYVLVGRRNPVTKETPVEIHWKF